MTHVEKNILLVILFIVFFIIPCPSLPFLDGFPLSHPLDLFILILIVFLFYILPWKKNIPTKKTLLFVVCLGLIKLSIALLSPLHGLQGNYYANTTNWEGPYERSTEFKNKNFTRIDSHIAFYNIGYSFTREPFPLWFLNDNSRFNWYLSNHPDRKKIKFSAEWKGYLYVPKDDVITFFIETPEEAKLSIDQHIQVFSQKEAFLKKGLHEFDLKYAHPEKPEKKLILSWAFQNKEKTLIAPKYFFVRLISNAKLTLDSFLHKLNPIIFSLHFILLLFIFFHFAEKISWKTLFQGEKQKLFWFFLGTTLILFSLLYFKKASNPSFNLMKGGDDELTHLTHARDIVLNGLLNPLDHLPFFFVPGYRYILALFHLLFGESIFMIIFAQRILFCLNSVLIYAIAKKLFNIKVAWISLFLNFISPVPHTFSRKLFPLTSAVFFTSLMFLFLLKIISHPKKILWPILGGTACGLSILMRPNFMLFPLFVVPWLYFVLDNKKTFFKQALLFIVGCSFVISLITLRNYVVSKQFVLISTSGPMNLWEGNIPPSSVNLDGIEKNKFYNCLNFSPLVRQVIEFAKQEPVLFLKNIGIKVLYLLGIRLRIEDRVFAWDIFLFMILSLAGMLLFSLKNSITLNHSLFFGFILIQLSTLILIKPWIHGHRLQGAIMPFMTLYMSYFISHLLFQGKNTPP